MNTRELQDEIIRLKKEKGVCLLAHAYQSQDILEVADYTGDSYGLSLKAKESDAQTIIMCGVRFMAETVKVLSPEKTVYIANSEALCPMAQQFDLPRVKQLRKQYPDYAIVAYINTTTELKTGVDVVVTSSSAKRIISNMKEDKILFIPDSNLGGYLKKQLPNKTIELMRGGCPTHMRVHKGDVLRAKKAHPNALVLVHPECLAEVTELADYAGSTTGIMNYAKESDAKEFIIGTENSIVQHLQFACPDKKFYMLSKECVCHNMKATTLMDVYQTLKGDGGLEIQFDDDLIKGARRAIDRMIELGG